MPTLALLRSSCNNPVTTCLFSRQSIIYLFDNTGKTASLQTLMEENRPLSDPSFTTITSEKRTAKRTTASSRGGDVRGSLRDQPRSAQRRPKSTKIKRGTFRSTLKPPPSSWVRIRRFFVSFVDSNRKLSPGHLPLLILELILLPIVLQLGLFVVGVLSVLALLLLPVFLLLRATDFKEIMAET
jgi:hypothetical protein